MWKFSNIQVSEGSITEPVTLLEAKAWSNIDHADHDSLLTSMITGAREDIEQELQVKLVDSSVSLYASLTKEHELTDFPWSLVVPAALTVNELTDGEADELLVVDEDYYFNGSLKLLSEGKYLIEYDVTPVVPTAIKEAIMMLVAYRYNNRGDQELQHGIPEDIERKISKYRKIWL